MKKLAILDTRSAQLAFRETLSQFYNLTKQPVPVDLNSRCFRLVKLNVEEILSTRSAFLPPREIVVDGSQVVFGRITTVQEQQMFLKLHNSPLLNMMYRSLTEQISGVVPAHSWSIWTIIEQHNTLFLAEQVSYNVDEQINQHNDLTLEIDLSELFRLITIALSYRNIHVEPERFKWLFLHELSNEYPQLKIDVTCNSLLTPNSEYIYKQYLEPVIKHLGLRYFNYTGYDYYYHCTMDQWCKLICTRMTIEQMISTHHTIDELVDSYQRGDFLLPAERERAERYILANPDEFYR